jgi:hypothetical protein
MKKYFVPLLLFAMQAKAQNKQEIADRQAIGIEPLALIQIYDGGLFLTYDYRISNRIALAADAGWIFYSAYLQQAKHVGGYSFRPSIRFFVNPAATIYVEPQFTVKHVVYTIYDWLDKQVSNGVAGYQQLQDFRYVKNVVGGNVLVGFVLPTGATRLKLDLYVGLGAKFKTNYIQGEPESSYRRERAVLNIYGNDLSMPAFPFGVRLRYMLRKRAAN